MSKHTPEPWRVCEPFEGKRGYEIADSAMNRVCCDITEASARHIVACVNFCAGVSTENLETNEPLLWLAEQYNTVKDQRDDLLEALDQYQSVFDQMFAHFYSNGVFNCWGKPFDCTSLNDVHSNASKAIARVKGGEK